MTLTRMACVAALTAAAVCASGRADAQVSPPAATRPAAQPAMQPPVQPAVRRDARFVADAHRRYRQSQERVVSGRVTLPKQDAAAAKPAADRKRTAGRRKGRATARSAGRAPGAPEGEGPRSAAHFRLSPRTPQIGTPEWTREQEHSRQREAELSRRMRAICGNC